MPRWVLPALAIGLAACRGAPVAEETPAFPEAMTRAGRASRTGASPGEALTGTVTVGGSSTVMPISTRLAEEFRTQHPDVRVPVEVSGTGGGFRKFCGGELDIAGASRPINAAELELCAANRIEYIELPIAFDSVSVVVNPKNTFVECLTVAELMRMWEPAARGKVNHWNQIRSDFPARPLRLFGPGTDSGTFDYFTLAIVGAQGSSRSDYTASEDDRVLADSVAQDADALGYFGYAYYLLNRDKLKLVAVDSGYGCVLPSAQTVAGATYQPLSRPIFIYVNKASVSRAETAAFARLYLDPEQAARVLEAGYVPLPTIVLRAAASRLNRGVTGTRFGGRGALVGVSERAF
jgi:phosphate transport system substrate-binding protein